MSRAEWSADTASIDRQISEPSVFSMPNPDELTGNTPWERAQTEEATVRPAQNDAEWWVSMETSDEFHRLVFVLDGATLRAGWGSLLTPCRSR